MKKAAEQYIGQELTSENIKSNLSRFIRFIEQNKISSIDYKQHVNVALRKKYIIIKYEDLLGNGVEALAKALMELLKKPIDKDEIARIYEKQSFESKINKKQNAQHFLRKGV